MQGEKEIGEKRRRERERASVGRLLAGGLSDWRFCGETNADEEEEEEEERRRRRRKSCCSRCVDGLMVAGACWRWTGGSTGLQGEERS